MCLHNDPKNTSHSFVYSTGEQGYVWERDRERKKRTWELTHNIIENKKSHTHPSTNLLAGEPGK